MGWPGPKLQPGERLVHRLSLQPLWLPALMTATGLGLAVAAILQLAAGSERIVIEIVHAAGSLILFGVGILTYRAYRTCTMVVTDRRLLVRDDGGGYQELPLAEIDAVTPYRLGDGLFVTGGGRKIVVPCKHKAAERICAAIAAAKGAARMRAVIAAAKEAPA